MEKTSLLVISTNKELQQNLRKELKEDYEVITFDNLLDGLDMLRESDFEVMLLDENLNWFTFDEAMKKVKGIGKDIFVLGLLSDENPARIKEIKMAGIYDYILKPINKREFDRLIDHVLNNIEILKEKRDLEKKLLIIEKEEEMIGQSNSIKQLKQMIEKVALGDTTVLILGENGVGKELVAKEIYRRSPRYRKPFITLNCAAISSNAIEAELFGYEKGAFTGANLSKKGIIEEAHTGTLFLDEIGELDVKTQAKLLRVIEYGELRRVGSSKTLKVDVRFIAATNKKLEDEVRRGNFRKDLYHRLTNFPIYVMPLKDRKEDIPLLVNYFLNKIVEELHKDMIVFSGEAMKYLIDYNYPGNVRELRNIIERIVILSNDRVISVEDLPLELKMKSDTLENKVVIGLGPLKQILEKEIYELAEVERVVIGMALQRTRWNKQETAKVLGIGRTTLYEKIKRYNLDRRLIEKEMM
ncbi:acetoacetate metabolism regulatory protein AtoC [Haliovirga abyssi]|uniref:Acetoacetate metabolism regulatory protein AtoC n=1 Tax=Haliovirga abyssi TaxID=2996794 RepID=A0AAU9DUB1_9FUSO|nr:acetoacetate metabolism regulatory protein AtoC [Haliovirga abyssi]